MEGRYDEEIILLCGSEVPYEVNSKAFSKVRADDREISGKSTSVWFSRCSCLKESSE